MTVLSAGKDIGQLEFSYIADKMQNDMIRSFWKTVSKFLISETCIYHMTQPSRTWLFALRK